MLKKTSIVIVAVTIIVVTFFLYGNSNRDYKALGSQLKVSHIIYNPNKPLPSFSLVDQDNQLFNNDNLKDGWTLLLFIYTHCPDVCPTELLDMSTLKKLMLKDKAISTPKVVAITFDPLRDTPEVLKEYVRHFDKDFIGVSGEQHKLTSLLSLSVLIMSVLSTMKKVSQLSLRPMTSYLKVHCKMAMLLIIPLGFI